jgi:hypothetical protein
MKPFEELIHSLIQSDHKEIYLVIDYSDTMSLRTEINSTDLPWNIDIEFKYNVGHSLNLKDKYNYIHEYRLNYPDVKLIVTTQDPIVILGASKDAVFYKVYKDEEGSIKFDTPITDISDYSANILITSPLFNMDSAKSRAYNDKENYLSDDDYKKHQLNKKIDEMLENDSDEDIKLDILKQLEEHNE